MLHDHFATYCCINSETNLHDQHSEKYHIKWDNISDDQKTLYSDNHDGLAIEIWADVLSCNLLFVMTLPITDNLIVFTVLYLKVFMYQLILLIKGLNIEADKSLKGISAAEKHFSNWCRND